MNTNHEAAEHEIAEMLVREFSPEASPYDIAKAAAHMAFRFLPQARNPMYDVYDLPPAAYRFMHATDDMCTGIRHLEDVIPRLEDLRDQIRRSMAALLDETKMPAWSAFLEARARCIHEMTAEGKSDAQIASDLSLDGPSQVQLIRGVTTP
jgi:DNA-binding NarL/FixJ family response regulator